MTVRDAVDLVLLIKGYIKYAVEMASGGEICISNCMIIDLGIQVILSSVQFEWLQCWYY
jgi:hypothetical protein